MHHGQHIVSSKLSTEHVTVTISFKGGGGGGGGQRVGLWGQGKTERFPGIREVGGGGGGGERYVT